MRSLLVTEGRVLGNRITDCGWQEAEYHFECAGIKLLVTRRTLVAGNLISAIRGGSGIWLDWDNRGSRVTRNLIMDVESGQGAIFVEASSHPNLIDNNIIWNIDGPGYFGGESSNQIVACNLFGKVSGPAFLLIVHTERTQMGKKLASEDNLIVGNLFFDAGQPQVTSDRNTLRQNLELTSSNEIGIDLPAKHSRETSSRALRASLRVGGDPLRLAAEPLATKPAELLKVLPPPEIQVDYFGRARPQAETIPGPWPGLFGPVGGSPPLWPNPLNTD
jgi:hypothetical protein